MSETAPNESKPPDEPMSLERLTSSFAEMFGARASGDSEKSQDDSAAGLDPSLPLPSEDRNENDPCEITPSSILEAMLFVGHPDNRPLTAEQVAAVVRGVEPEEVPGMIRDLNLRYDADGAPYEIATEIGGYRLALRKEFHRLRDKFFGRAREARLSQAAVDVLAIVAYNQPVAADEIGRLRGTPSGPILSQLVRRRLLRIERPEENRRRPLYHTTGRFLQLFHLRNLDELPRSQDVERK